MKPFFHLLLIVFIAVSSLSGSKLSVNKFNAATSEHSITAAETETSSGKNLNLSVILISFFKDLTLEAPHSDDEAGIHEFCFDRLRTKKRFGVIYCILAKLILVVTHISLLVCIYLNLCH